MKSTSGQQESVPWATVFLSEKDGVIVEVCKRRRREFSMRIGRTIVRDGTEIFISHLPVRISGHGTAIVGTINCVVDELMERAHQFIQQDAQKDEDAYIAQRHA